MCVCLDMHRYTLIGHIQSLALLTLCSRNFSRIFVSLSDLKCNCGGIAGRFTATGTDCCNTAFCAVAAIALPACEDSPVERRGEDGGNRLDCLFSVVAVLVIVVGVNVFIVAVAPAAVAPAAVAPAVAIVVESLLALLPNKGATFNDVAAGEEEDDWKGREVVD